MTFSLPPSISNQGVVVNNNNMGVGTLLGDGVVLTFSDPEVVGQFRICLLLANPLPSNSSYTVPDFGYPDPNYQQIHPLGMCHISVTIIFAC